MKKIALKTYGKIATFILSLLGLLTTTEGCDERDANIKPMYGVPTADYVVNGKVTIESTDTPIEGIGIIIPNPNRQNRRDTFYTNSQGEYNAELKDMFPLGNEKMKVIAKDLDGEKNGEFQADSIEISFTQKDLIKKGSGNWYEGTYKKNNQNFSLDYAMVAEYGIRRAPFKDIDKIKE